MRTINCFTEMISCMMFTEQEKNIDFSEHTTRKDFFVSSNHDHVQDRTVRAEIRLDRVIDTRRKLKEGKYNLSENLSVAMDKLLEEILEEESKESS